MDAQCQALAKTILLVDERDKDRIITKWFLGDFGFVVDSTRTAQDALALFGTKNHALVITENFLAGITGPEMAHIIKLRSPTTPVILCSAQLPENRTCLDSVIQKPVHLMTLKETVERILEGGPHEFQKFVPACRSSACSRGPFWVGS